MALFYFKRWNYKVFYLDSLNIYKDAFIYEEQYTNIKTIYSFIQILIF